MTTIDHARVNALAAELGIDLDDPIVGMEDDPIARFEHLVHEVGHALSLRIPVRKDPGGLNLPKVVGAHIDGDSPCKNRRRYREEATTLAAGYRFFTITGTAPLLTEDERTWSQLATDQGCSKREWQRAMRSPRTFNVTKKLIVYFVQQDVLHGPYVKEKK